MSKKIKGKYCKDSGKTVSMMNSINEKGAQVEKCLAERNCKNESKGCADNTYSNNNNQNY